MKVKLAMVIAFVAAMLLVGNVTASMATELVWTPVNPSFAGGNPLNGAFLLGKAQSQDNNKDPEAEDNLSRLDDFQENLNRSILSILSARIVEKAFGDEDLPNGTFRVGDFEVTITEQVGQLDVVVVDLPNNNRTEISIPTL
jgi:curli production assembly/transport component CsgF